MPEKTPSRPHEDFLFHLGNSQHDQTIGWMAIGETPPRITTMERARMDRKMRSQSAEPREGLSEEARQEFIRFNPHDMEQMDIDPMQMDVPGIRDRMPVSVLAAYDHYRYYVEQQRWGIVRVLSRFLGDDQVYLVAVKATHGGYLELFDARGGALASGRKYKDEAITWDGEIGACRESVIYDD